MSFKKIIFLIRLLFSSLLFCFVVKHAGAERSLDTIKKLDVIWFLGMLVLHMLFDIVPATRLSYALFGKMKITKIRMVYVVNLKAFSLSLVLPGDLAGYVVRVGMLRDQIDIKKAAATVFLDKLMFIVVSSILGVLLSILLIEYKFLTIYFTLIVFVVILVLFFLAKYLWLFACKIPFLVKHKTELEELKLVCVELVKGKFIMASFVASLTCLLLMSFWVKFIALHLGVNVSQSVLLLFVCTLTLVQFLPVSVGGIGLRESAAVPFFGIIGILPDTAVSIAVIISLFTVARAFIGAIVFGLSAIFSKDQVKRLMEN